MQRAGLGGAARVEPGVVVVGPEGRVRRSRLRGAVLVRVQLQLERRVLASRSARRPVALGLVVDLVVQSLEL